MSPSREQPRSAEREMKCGSVLRGLARLSPRVGVAEDAPGWMDGRTDATHCAAIARGRGRAISNGASFLCRFERRPPGRRKYSFFSKTARWLTL